MNSANKNLDDSMMNGVEEDESGKTMSLMSLARGKDGDAAPAPELDLESMKPGSKLLSNGTLLIVAVFIVGAGTLLMMRMSQKDLGRPVTSQVEQTIKDALNKFAQNTDPSGPAIAKPKTGSLLDDAAMIVQTLKNESTALQVPIENLKKNPFALPRFKEDKPEQKKDDSKEREEILRKRKLLEQEFAKLKLQSIVQGPRPVAIINGDIVQAGQALGSFVVQSINELSVVLEHDGEPFFLEMKSD